MRKLKPENEDHALTKALELQAYLKLEGRNPIGTTSSASSGVNHMTNQFLTENTAIFDEFVRSLKRDTKNMPHNRNRGSRDNSRTKNEIEITPWTGEAKMTHGTIQEADKEITHEIPETHTCLRAIDKTFAMIQARDLDKDTILESASQNNNIDQFGSSHLAMTEDKIAKTKTLAAEMHKTNHNHHTKADNMTLILILDTEAEILQPGPKTWCARIARELITFLEKVKFVLIENWTYPSRVPRPEVKEFKLNKSTPTGLRADKNDKKGPQTSVTLNSVVDPRSVF